MPVAPESTVQISGIIDTASYQADGHGYLGFIITYPNGRIENKVLEYDRQSYREVQRQIESLHQLTVQFYYLRQ